MGQKPGDVPFSAQHVEGLVPVRAIYNYQIVALFYGLPIILFFEDTVYSRTSKASIQWEEQAHHI